MDKLLRIWRALVELGMCYNGYAQLHIANAVNIKICEMDNGVTEAPLQIINEGTDEAFHIIRLGTEGL